MHTSHLIGACGLVAKPAECKALVGQQAPKLAACDPGEALGRRGLASQVIVNGAQWHEAIGTRGLRIIAPSFKAQDFVANLRQGIGHRIKRGREHSIDTGNAPKALRAVT